MTNLFEMIEVNNLTCEYAPGTPALSVHELNIRSGELTFVVGASGSGKSTLLEALGLMTETARSTPEYSFSSSQQRRALPWNYVITGNGMRPNELP